MCLQCSYRLESEEHIHATNIPKHIYHKHLKKFALNFVFCMSLYFLKIALLSANENEGILSCILLGELSN